MIQDEELSEDLVATADELRARAGIRSVISPSSRIPRAQEIAEALANYNETPLPPLSVSPEPAEEHPPSPRTPPEWEYDDEEQPEEPQPDDPVDPMLLQFVTPSTVPQLLQRVGPVSPETPYQLSALDILGPRHAHGFDATAEEALESDIDAVDSGDHLDLQQSHNGLPSRQNDVLPYSGGDLLESTPRQGPFAFDFLPHTPFAPSPRAPPRPRSCPPQLDLPVYVAPRTPPIPLKTTREIAIQAGPEYAHEPSYTSVAVQTKVDLDQQVHAREAPL